MKKLLLLSIALVSVQSFNNLFASEVGFSTKFNGKYILTNEKVAIKHIESCLEEVTLKVEDGNLNINDTSIVEFSNGCTTYVDKSERCNISSPISYESNYSHPNWNLDNYEGTLLTDVEKIGLIGFKRNTFIMSYRKGKSSIFQSSRPYDYKCTYKRI